MSATVSTPAAAPENSSEGAATPTPGGKAAAGVSEAASGAATETPPPVPAPADAEDKVKLAAKTLARAKAAGQRQRELEAKAEREALRAQQLSERLQQQDKERERDRAERDAWKKDPVTALKGLGLTARQLAAKALEEGTPEARFAALEARLADSDAARQALETRLANEQQSANHKRAVETFLAKVKPEQYPVLSKLSPRRVLALAHDAFAHAQEMNYKFRDADTEILEQLESEFSSSTGSTSNTSAKPKTVPGSMAAVPGANTPPTSRTVTSDLAGRWTQPANFDQLTDFEQKKELARMLELQFPSKP